MKKLLLLSSIFIVAASMAHAQTELTTTITSQKHDTTFSNGSDFWFAMPSNYWGHNQGGDGQYLRIYITSTKNTIAHVAILNGTIYPISVKAYSLAAFNAPIAWEMETSGVVENKAVHVYSTDADLTVYFVSHNAYTVDGSYIIPTIGCGTDYVVAGYSSFNQGSGTYIEDDPSEFTIAANTDNTTIDITPAADLRATADSNANFVAYPQGVPFQIMLNRGQSVQFMPVQATKAESPDVTGTIIHSSQPIGVIGGSMCTNIPSDFPYCDMVMHMLPPVRTWGKTYYTTSFAQTAGITGHNYGLYLFVASKAGQVIHRQNCISGDNIETVIETKFGIYWSEEELAQKFWSDAPFMLVEYINSSSYPDYGTGNGDPAMTLVPALENFTKSVLYAAPMSIGSQQPYDNYANVIVNTHDVGNTTFRGKPISTYPSSCLDSTHEMFVVPHVPPGVDSVVSDSGVGVYGYGYGYDQSYAWCGGFAQGAAAQPTPDTVPPRAVVTSTCFHARVELSDTGAFATKLTAIQVDSESNMTFLLDTNLLQGIARDTTGYDLRVKDSTKPAFLEVSAQDSAGNRTTVTTTYSPPVTLSPRNLWFGAVTLADSAIVFDTLINTGKLPDSITQLRLVEGTAGFSLDSAASMEIASGERRALRISYHPTLAGSAFDTLVVTSGCLQVSGVLAGAGEPPAGVASSQNENDGARLDPIEDGASARVVIPATWASSMSDHAATLEIEDLLGVTVLRATATSGEVFDLRHLPRGVYFYRISSGRESSRTDRATNKIILGE